MQGKLTDFVLRITLPCMIFNSFSMHITLDMLKQAACVSGGVFYLLRGMARWKSCLQHVSEGEKNPSYSMPHSSITCGVFGAADREGGARRGGNCCLASIFIIPNRIFMWTAGVSIFTAEADKKAAFKKVMLNPCVIVIFIGLFRSFTDFTLPEFLAKSITGLGNCTTPLSMVLIGTMMTELTLASFKDWSTVYLAFMRLVALPFLALFIMRLLNADPIMTGCAVILTAMPAGSTTALLAEKYGSDPVYASKCLLTNTLFSLITIPIMTLFI